MSISPVAVVGIAWYRAESYPKITALMADGASFPKSYDSWRQKAVRMEREYARRGSLTTRVDVDPVAFDDWCRSRNLSPDSAARGRYVDETVAAESAGPGG